MHNNAHFTIIFGGNLTSYAHYSNRRGKFLVILSENFSLFMPSCTIHFWCLCICANMLLFICASIGLNKMDWGNFPCSIVVEDFVHFSLSFFPIFSSIHFISCFIFLYDACHSMAKQPYVV